MKRLFEVTIKFSGKSLIKKDGEYDGVVHQYNIIGNDDIEARQLAVEKIRHKDYINQETLVIEYCEIRMLHDIDNE